MPVSLSLSSLLSLLADQYAWLLMKVAIIIAQSLQKIIHIAFHHAIYVHYLYVCIYIIFFQCFHFMILSSMIVSIFLSRNNL